MTCVSAMAEARDAFRCRRCLPIPGTVEFPFEELDHSAGYPTVFALQGAHTEIRRATAISSRPMRLLPVFDRSRTLRTRHERRRSEG